MQGDYNETLIKTMRTLNRDITKRKAFVKSPRPLNLSWECGVQLERQVVYIIADYPVAIRDGTLVLTVETYRSHA